MNESMNPRQRLGAAADVLELLLLSLRLQAGRRVWLVPLLPLAWPLILVLLWVIGWADLDPEPVHAQNQLIGIPLALLAIGLGLQVVAGEIEDRTLEVCYTVPGGASRIWFSKLAGAALLLAAAEGVLALFARLAFTEVPAASLYGAWQGALFFLALSAFLGALLGNRLSAGLFAVALLFFSGLISGFGDAPTRYSPMFNPLALTSTATPAEQILAWTVQNRIGVPLAILALLALLVSRAERRETLLSEGG